MKIVQAVMICQKKSMAARGWGLFSLYIYIENFNDHLVRNHWTDFSITSQECFFCNPLPRLGFHYDCRNVPLSTLYQEFSSYHNSSKNMAARGRGLFSLYIYIENLKNLLVRNQWADFNITWQECFFGDPLTRLFKPS